MTTILTILFAPLIAGLGANDFRTRDACQTLAERCSIVAKPALTHGLKDPDAEVRERCRIAISRLPSPMRILGRLTFCNKAACSEELAAWYAADEQRWSQLEPMAQALDLGDGVSDCSSLVHWGFTREQAIQGVINGWRMLWAHDGTLADGVDAFAAPPPPQRMPEQKSPRPCETQGR